MAYRLLSLTAISGEFPTDQLNRLPGSPYYLESVVTALKKDGLLRTYYRDKLRGYRLGPRAKATLLENRPDRFASYLTGDTDTNRLKCEIDRRLRLHRLAETYVTMDNVCIGMKNRQFLRRRVTLAAGLSILLFSVPEK